MRLPPENRPTWTTYIQWKGTDLCMDFWCPECGEHSHFDGFWAHHIECSVCKAIFKMPTDVPVERVPSEPRPDCVLVDVEANGET
jgi:uncharacterized protein (DUF983 family)